MPQDPDDTNDELVQEFYGIDARTFRVDSVAITRSGKITRWTEKGYIVEQMVGRDMRAEVIRLFGLIELIEVHPRTPNSNRRSIMVQLQAKALELLPTSQTGEGET